MERQQPRPLQTRGGRAELRAGGVPGLKLGSLRGRVSGDWRAPFRETQTPRLQRGLPCQGRRVSVALTVGWGQGGLRDHSCVWRGGHPVLPGPQRLAWAGGCRPPAARLPEPVCRPRDGASARAQAALSPPPCDPEHPADRPCPPRAAASSFVKGARRSSARGVREADGGLGNTSAVTNEGSLGSPRLT